MVFLNLFNQSLCPKVNDLDLGQIFEVGHGKWEMVVFQTYFCWDSPRTTRSQFSMTLKRCIRCIRVPDGIPSSS